MDKRDATHTALLELVENALEAVENAETHCQTALSEVLAIKMRLLSWEQLLRSDEHQLAIVLKTKLR